VRPPDRAAPQKRIVLTTERDNLGHRAIHRLEVTITFTGTRSENAGL
jgi:hypothetical protein